VAIANALGGFDTWRIANPRYSRVQICATVVVSGEYGTYNPITGAYTHIASPATPAGGGSYAALAFSGSTLYGDNLVAGGSGTTHLVTIDPTSGVVTDIGPSVPHLDAIAVEEIPEPGTIGLFSAGGLMMLLATRRKTR
jgi:hypothetical protein